jgi:hypothetical protein
MVSHKKTLKEKIQIWARISLGHPTRERKTKVIQACKID